ncbi:MAG: hypothetical protein KA371_09195 [Acidobacteria bacterium]|nr:hypothetical protein [Acidobacteriota bacterium]
MKTIYPLTFVALFLAAATVSAARPANLANTTWTLQVNGSIEPLTITTQGGAGAPGAANCRAITGAIRNLAEVRGWYCPSTGRIHLVHTNMDSNRPVRVFTGNVSDDVSGQLLHMAGTMTVLNSAFGDLGEYNFSASQ